MVKHKLPIQLFRPMPSHSWTFLLVYELLDYCIHPGSYRVSTDVYFGAHFSLVWRALLPVSCAGCSPAVIEWEAGGRRKTAPHQGHPPLARSGKEGEGEGGSRGGRRGGGGGGGGGGEGVERRERECRSECKSGGRRVGKGGIRECGRGGTREKGVRGKGAQSGQR